MGIVMHIEVMAHYSHLGGVMVSVLAIRLKVYRFKSGQGDGFLKAKKSASRLPSEGKLSQRDHVVSFYSMLKVTCKNE
jgi:hypothetical protein